MGKIDSVESFIVNTATILFLMVQSFKNVINLLTTTKSSTNKCTSQAKEYSLQHI